MPLSETDLSRTLRFGESQAKIGQNSDFEHLRDFGANHRALALDGQTAALELLGEDRLNRIERLGPGRRPRNHAGHRYEFEPLELGRKGCERDCHDHEHRRQHHSKLGGDSTRVASCSRVHLRLYMSVRCAPDPEVFLSPLRCA